MKKRLTAATLDQTDMLEFGVRSRSRDRKLNRDAVDRP